MRKIVFIVSALIYPLWGGSEGGLGGGSDVKSHSLEQNCLLCHREHQIPSAMIYRRYLMKFSAKDTIKNRMFDYLKKPSTKESIMPAPFFKKFSIKEPSDMNDTILKESIDSYIERFDVDKRIFVVPKK